MVGMEGEGLVESIFYILKRVKIGVMEIIFTNDFPDHLYGIEFGRIRGDMGKSDMMWNVKGFGLMPKSLIEEDNDISMRIHTSHFLEK